MFCHIKDMNLIKICLKKPKEYTETTIQTQASTDIPFIKASFTFFYNYKCCTR